MDADHAAMMINIYSIKKAEKLWAAEK